MESIEKTEPEWHNLNDALMRQTLILTVSRRSIMNKNLIKSNFLYRTWDGYAHTMRLIFRMKAPVEGQELREAVQEAAVRYPYLCVRVIREGETYRIETNHAPIPVIDGETPVCLGSEAANGHFITVSHSGSKIIFDVYHNLCDAAGILPWLKTVIFLYLRKTADPELDPEGIHLPGEEIPESEISDPYERLDLSDVQEPFDQTGMQPAFIPDDRYAERPGRKNYYVRANAEKFVGTARRMGGSPVVLFSYFMKETMEKLFPDRGGLPISVSIPHSLRDSLNAKDNFHDLLAPVTLRYDDEIDSLPMDAQLKAGREAILRECDWNNMRRQLRMNMVFAGKMETLPTVKERRGHSREAVSQFIAHPETMCITYPGKTSWGSIAAYIEDVYYHCSVLSAPLLIIALPFEEEFFFTFEQRDDTDVYAKTFVSLLEENGIPAEMTGCSDEVLCPVYIP